MTGDAAKVLELLPGGHALRQEDLIQIIADAQIAPLPSAGEGWIGVANLRGNLIGVIDLGVLLGGAATSNGLLVAVSGNGLQYGLLCEGIKGASSLPAADGATIRRGPEDSDWLQAAPPGQPRLIDTTLLLADPRLQGRL